MLDPFDTKIQNVPRIWAGWLAGFVGGFVVHQSIDKKTVAPRSAIGKDRLWEVSKWNDGLMKKGGQTPATLDDKVPSRG